MSDLFAPPFEMIPTVRIAINIGCMFDIAGGAYETGKYGESILNGGMTPITGVVGIPNSFKSTIADYFQFTAYSRFKLCMHTYGMKYDTEMNVTEARQAALAGNIEGLEGEDNPIENGRWNITDKVRYMGNVWFEKYKEYCATKVKSADKLQVNTPFLDRNGNNMTIMTPTFVGVDSFSEFETDDVADMRNDNELGDSGGNTDFMRQGRSKAVMITQLPALVMRSNTPMVLTAHVGKTINMDARAMPVKKMQYLKNGDTIKGVTDKFLFLTHQCWQCLSSIPMINDSTKAPEYPNGTDDDMKGDTDLNLVTLTLLRNKYGASGLIMQIIVSQEQGVLPALSEFHYIKTNDRFGLGGNVQNYFLDLLPEVKLSRTAIRPKINANAQLRRALNITSELLQMQRLWSKYAPLYCTPKELYDDLKAIGYDWDYILSHTRGYWLPDNLDDKHEKKFLSTLDLLHLRANMYKIVWWPKDKPLDFSKCKKIEGYRPGADSASSDLKALSMAP